MKLKQIILLSIAALLSQARLDFLHHQVSEHLGLFDELSCDPDLPPMSVGHHIFTHDNIHELEDIKRSNFVFIAVLTDSAQSPDKSCYLEPFLNQLHVDFSNKSHTHNEQEIKIYRIDKQLVPKMRNQEKDTFRSAPAIYVVKDRRYYQYKGELKKESFLCFVNKILNPYVQLRNDQDIETFLQTGVEYQEGSELFKYGFVSLGEEFANHKNKYRAILVLYDRSNIPSIYRRFIEAAENLANREDLRVGMLSDRARILQFLKKYKEQIGSHDSQNFILLVKNANEYTILDLEQHPEENLEEWINRNSLDLVHELDRPYVAKLVDMVKVPTLILFVDENSQSMIRSLEKIARVFYKELVYLYVQDPQILEVRHNLGASSSYLPTATIVTSKGIIYPLRSSDILTEDTLEQYIKNFLTGQIRPINNDKFEASIDYYMEKRLQRTQNLISLNLNKSVIDNTDQDVLVFFYSSEWETLRWKKSMDQANAFDTAAMRFQDHEFNTVRLCSYDVYRQGLPSWLIGIEIPSVILFPAKDKDQYVIYEDSLHKARAYMEFVAKYASIPIQLTENSHLPSRIAKPPPGGFIPQPPKKYPHETYEEL